MEFNTCGQSYQQLHNELEEIPSIQLRRKLWTHKERNYIVMLYHQRRSDWIIKRISILEQSLAQMHVCECNNTNIWHIYEWTNCDNMEVHMHSKPNDFVLNVEERAISRGLEPLKPSLISSFTTAATTTKNEGWGIGAVVNKEMKFFLVLLLPLWVSWIALSKNTNHLT